MCTLATEQTQQQLFSLDIHTYINRLKEKLVLLKKKMLYMPATTLATPVVFQETQPKPLQATTRYYMVQPTTLVPSVPLLNTGFVYPAYGLVTNSIEKTDTNKSQISEGIN